MREREPEGKRRIPTTRWSVVRAAAGAHTSRSREAFAVLCRQYHYPVYAFIRRSGVGAEDAKDLTQSFFAGLLSTNDLDRVDPSRGRFRAWLKVCVQHAVSNWRDHQRAQKRGGGAEVVSRDGEDEDEQRYRHEPSHDITPEKLFDQRWWLTLFQQALDALRSRYAEQGRAELFEACKSTLMGGLDERAADVARRLGMSEEAVRVASFRLRQRFEELFVAEVAQTLDDPSHVAEEIAELRQQLGGAR